MKIKLYLLASFFSIFSVIAQEKESLNVYKIPVNRVADIKIDKWIQNKPKDTLLNGKFLVINFWRTNCTVCDEGMKEIEKLQNEFKDITNLYFINLTDEKSTEVNNYFKQQNLSTSLIVASDKRKVTNLRSNGEKEIFYPMAALIDNSGTIIFVHFPKYIKKEIIQKMLDGKLESFSAFQF